MIFVKIKNTNKNISFFNLIKMGNYVNKLISKLFCINHQRTLILGLDGSGKTTILYIILIKNWRSD